MDMKYASEIKNAEIVRMPVNLLLLVAASGSLLSFHRCKTSIEMHPNFERWPLKVMLPRLGANARVVGFV